MKSPLSLVVVLVALMLACCATGRHPYNTTGEPHECPPSYRYTAVLLALRDELSRPDSPREVYLCQAKEQVEALQRDIPEHVLHHASESYTQDVKNMGGVATCHRSVDGMGVTRVGVDIVSETQTQVIAKLFIGSAYPNMQFVTYTFTKKDGILELSHRDRPARMMI